MSPDSYQSRPLRFTRFARVAGGLVLAIAALALAGWILDSPALRRLGPGPAAMSPVTAVCLLFAGAAVAVLNQRSPRALWTAQVLALPVGLVGLTRLVGYAYGTGGFQRIAGFTAMAPNTATALVLLAAGVLSARPEQGLMRVFSSQTHAGANFRRMILEGFAIPLSLGWLILSGERAGLYDAELAMALMICGSIAIFGVLLSRTARGSFQAERELRQSRHELQEYINGMSTLNAKVAPDGTMSLVNRIAEQASGLSAAELLRTNFLEGAWWGVDPEVKARVRAAFAKAVAGQPVSYDEQLFAFGTVIDIAFALAPVKDEQGRVSYVVAEGRDITRLKQSEQALAERTALLEATNQGLESFAYSVSHDLRAPLRAIAGFSRILVEDHSQALDQEALRLLDVIQRNTIRMGQLIDDLLAFSRLARANVVSAPLDMAAIVSGVIDELRTGGLAGQAQILVNTLPASRGDGALLRQVWVNLIGNGVKFSRPRALPRIEIAGRREAHETIYSVTDNGVGFDMAHAPKLFGVFERLHSAQDFEGTGVGLAIVKRVVERHGGRVWAEARLGEGAAFHFALPG